MSERQKYDPEVKAAVMAALLTGQSCAAVADEYQLPEGTVKAWWSRNKHQVATVATEKQAELGDLLADYLREVLTTLAAQARQFRDESWLKEQRASEVAVLHGVLTDKAIRILSALEPVDIGATPTE